jgi:threonine dehydratase
MTLLTLDDIVTARDRIASGLVATPCPYSPALSELLGCEVYCKLDFLQRTGSFKERGARNALLLLAPDKQQRGVIAASAGNHAQALAYHGQKLGVPVTVVMPTYAPLNKQMNCLRLGATVEVCGESFADARARADELADKHRLTYIHGFDDLPIIAGQGTLGLEVCEQVPTLDAILVPIGGGGLIAGVATAVKQLRPEVQVIGVEAANSACFSAAMAAGTPVNFPCAPTLADGLAVGKVGGHSLEIARPLIDRLVQVSEQQLALAIARLMELEKCVVEGAGAAPLAAMFTDLLADLAGKRVVLVLSGGNIDMTILGRLIDEALVADGRLTRFTAVISDRPGGLARLTALIAATGASIQEVTHDRAFSGPNVAAVNVLCTVETRDAAHIEELYRALTDAGVHHFAHVGGVSNATNGRAS